MPTRPAIASQADIERAIRALKASGVEHVRVVLTKGGVVVEPVLPRPESPFGTDAPQKPERIIIM